MDFEPKGGPILVVGDLMLDEYVYGESTRLSPEAPIPVVLYNSVEYRLGGAANVAANIKSLGGTAFLTGVAGKDANGEKLSDFVWANGINTQGIHFASNQRTTTKTRIIGNGQQIVRLDREDVPAKIGGVALDEHITIFVERHLDQDHSISAVVVSDYAKGVVDSCVYSTIRELSHKYRIPVFIDPKPANTALYNDHKWLGTVVTPNIHEVQLLTGFDCKTQISLEQAGRSLFNRFPDLDYVVITRGDKGLTLFSQSCMVDVAPHPVQRVYDVSGAGDTVIAALALAYCSGYEMSYAAHVANRAAGIAVSKPGTAVVTLDELRQD